MNPGNFSSVHLSQTHHCAGFVLYLSNSLLAEARHLDTSLVLAHRKVRHLLISGDRCRTCRRELCKPDSEVYLYSTSTSEEAASRYNLGKSWAYLNDCIAGNLDAPHLVVMRKCQNDPSSRIGRQATSSGVRYQRSLKKQWMVRSGHAAFTSNREKSSVQWAATHISEALILWELRTHYQKLLLGSRLTGKLQMHQARHKR